MRIRRAIIIPAILALSVAGSTCGWLGSVSQRGTRPAPKWLPASQRRRPMSPLIQLAQINGVAAQYTHVDL